MVNPEWLIALRDLELANDKALAWLIASWKRIDEDKEIALLEYRKHNKVVRAITTKMNEIAQANKIII